MFSDGAPTQWRHATSQPYSSLPLFSVAVWMTECQVGALCEGKRQRYGLSPFKEGKGTYPDDPLSAMMKIIAKVLCWDILIWCFGQSLQKMAKIWAIFRAAYLSAGSRRSRVLIGFNRWMNHASGKSCNYPFNLGYSSPTLAVSWNYIYHHT